jgi:hypothetical protein
MTLIKRCSLHGYDIIIVALLVFATLLKPFQFSKIYLTLNVYSVFPKNNHNTHI